ncbi:hypothetical protein KEM48_007823, partial [Puccinia striiformis f. sp. tritici PST-130]
MSLHTQSQPSKNSSLTKMKQHSQQSLKGIKYNVPIQKYNSNHQFKSIVCSLALSSIPPVDLRILIKQTGVDNGIDGEIQSRIISKIFEELDS